ncbi:MAG: HAD-IB family hydrolase [Pseudomonadota bacterium]
MSPNRHIAAFFDVDRTLVGPHSMEQVFASYLIRRRYLRPADLARYLGFLARHLDQLGEGLVQNNKYHLRHKDPAELAGLAADCFNSLIQPRISRAGRRAVERHRQRGHLVVLLTGSLRTLAELMARELGADLTLAADLAVEGGAYSGTLLNRRPYGPEKARLLRQVATSRSLDLPSSWAYGDHHSDLEALACVGHPVAVNPHPRLRRQALSRGWPIVNF